MAVGGIPMYLSYVTPGQSLAQTIDQLFFARKAKLKDEYDRLFNSIFNKPEKYRQVVTLLAGRQKGYSRDEIIRLSSIDSGAGLSQILKTLEACDFIEYYKPFENNRRQMMYRLTDPFCLFYLANVNGKSRSETYWRDNENLPSLSTWRGRAFKICVFYISNR
ncbi:MAG: MarR family winged helix-turn-helix transcriptional regulator [Prevotella sp.]|nr:MarR family winged helix-turn-helix transcriptional regulator [Prevotella sp.]